MSKLQTSQIMHHVQIIRVLLTKFQNRQAIGHMPISDGPNASQDHLCCVCSSHCGIGWDHSGSSLRYRTKIHVQIYMKEERVLYSYLTNLFINR